MQSETARDERYQSRFGYWRAHVTHVFQRCMDCGDLHFGFARVKCEDCGHEYLPAFSCKRRHFCPSCRQKRVGEFGEWLCEQVLKYVPHRQWMFSIPKRLRIFFLLDRKLHSKLSRCAWKVLNLYLTQAAAHDGAKPGAAIAVQSFGDFQNFNPHLRVPVTDGCFYNDAAFRVRPPPNTVRLEKLFRYEVLKCLKLKGKSMTSSLRILMNWRHSGFNV